MALGRRGGDPFDSLCSSASLREKGGSSTAQRASLLGSVPKKSGFGIGLSLPYSTALAGLSRRAPCCKDSVLCEEEI